MTWIRWVTDIKLQTSWSLWNNLSGELEKQPSRQEHLPREYNHCNPVPGALISSFSLYRHLPSHVHTHSHTHNFFKGWRYGWIKNLLERGLSSMPSTRVRQLLEDLTGNEVHRPACWHAHNYKNKYFRAGHSSRHWEAEVDGFLWVQGQSVYIASSRTAYRDSTTTKQTKIKRLDDIDKRWYRQTYILSMHKRVFIIQHL